MSEQSIPHTLSSFLKDLVEIRDKNGVTLDDIRVRTKVYPHIIAQFEEDGLNEHPLFNVLYLKAFVRSYAEVVGISPDIASESYERALNGKYDRRLAVEYLGMEPAVYEIPEEPEAEEALGIDATSHEAEADADAVAGDRFRIKITQPQVLAGSLQSVSFDVKTYRDSVLSGLGRLWNSVVQLGGNQGVWQWGILGGCIVLGAFMLIRLITSQNDSLLSQDPPPSVQETSVTNGSSSGNAIGAVDSLAIARSVQLNTVIERLNDADSLHVTVVAAYGKLDPVRVQVDRDLRRPYWLEEGDSMMFWVKDRIAIEDNLEMMAILFEDVAYPIADTDTSARVIISRDSARSFLYAELQ